MNGGEQEDGVKTNRDPAEERENASDASTQASTLTDQQSSRADGPGSPTRGRYHLRDRKKPTLCRVEEYHDDRQFGLNLIEGGNNVTELVTLLSCVSYSLPYRSLSLM